VYNNEITFIFLKWHHTIYYQCVIEYNNYFEFVNQWTDPSTPQRAIQQNIMQEIYRNFAGNNLTSIKFENKYVIQARPTYFQLVVPNLEIWLIFISIDIQLISVKRLLDHCTSLIGQVRHSNFQNKLMYFTRNNSTWIKKYVFGIKTLHHAFYYQCLICNIVIIFNLFDMRFNPLKHLEYPNRKKCCINFHRKQLNLY
jgi:hypothetical protein